MIIKPAGITEAGAEWITGRFIRVADGDTRLYDHLYAAKSPTYEYETYCQFADPIDDGILVLNYSASIIPYYSTWNLDLRIGFYLTPIEIFDPEITWATRPAKPSKFLGLSASETAGYYLNSGIGIEITDPIYGLAAWVQDVDSDSTTELISRHGVLWGKQV